MATSSFFNDDNKDRLIKGMMNIVQSIARLLGYPNVEGMAYKDPDVTHDMSRWNLLETHKTQFPPQDIPNNLIETVLGTVPKVSEMTRVIYESIDDGFYNFYVQNYKNTYFLPDWLSQFIQIRFNQCLDIQVLETFRDVLFLCFFVFYQLVSLRIALFWFLSINPYTFPWIYVVALVDWTDDVLQGLVPVVAGINLTATVTMGIVGSIGDSLNHLVFTMPFLPSEGEEVQMMIKGRMREVVIFRYLPILWYRYPIPNDIREFWYYERPDILKFMQESYKDLDIQFLPDQIVEQLNATKQLSNAVPVTPSDITTHVSTQLLSTETLIHNSNELTNGLIYIPELVHNNILTYLDRLI